MKLNVNLSALWENVNKMGASEIDFSLSNELGEIDPIDKALNKGVEVNLKDINFDTGLASYQGRQVLLYIKDHGRRVETALCDGSKGNRYHIADCSKLDEMRRKGRFDRYVVKNDLTGIFDISGENWETKAQIQGKTELKVCKLCLNHLNYQGYRNGDKSQIFKAFNLSDFFDKYSSFFRNAPSGVANTKYSGYTDDWSEISQRIKSQVSYICQECGVDLNSNKKLIHVHHINGVKQDNRRENLRPLCVDCHRKQPNHKHLFVSHADTVQINYLRNKQGLIVVTCWKDVYTFSDPALYGIIDILEQKQVELPKIGWELTRDNGTVDAHIELGWPRQQIAIVIEKKTAIIARKLGWEAFSMRNTLQYTDKIIFKLATMHITS